MYIPLAPLGTEPNGRWNGAIGFPFHLTRSDAMLTCYRAGGRHKNLGVPSHSLGQTNHHFLDFRKIVGGYFAPHTCPLSASPMLCTYLSRHIKLQSFDILSRWNYMDYTLVLITYKIRYLKFLP